MADEPIAQKREEQPSVSTQLMEGWMYPLVVTREGDRYRICAKDEHHHCLVDLTDAITQQLKT